MMIWYEVRADVPADQAGAYEAYLREEHIPDLMETGCFVEAAFCRADAGGAPEAAPGGAPGSAIGSKGSAPAAEGAPEARVHFRSAYLAPDRAALDRYFTEHAGRLREHALRRFPDGLHFARGEWRVLERWRGTAPGSEG
jgi:hypothetical protein